MAQWPVARRGLRRALHLVVLRLVPVLTAALVGAAVDAELLDREVGDRLGDVLFGSSSRPPASTPSPVPASPSS